MKKSILINGELKFSVYLFSIQYTLDTDITYIDLFPGSWIHKNILLVYPHVGVCTFLSATVWFGRRLRNVSRITRGNHVAWLTPFGYPAAGKKTRNRTRHSPPSLVRSLARTQECVCTRQTGGRNPISRMCAGLTRLSHVRLRDLLIDGCTTSLPLIGRLIVSRFRYLFWLFGFAHAPDSSLFSLRCRSSFPPCYFIFMYCFIEISCEVALVEQWSIR